MANYHLTLTHRSRIDGYSAFERARYIARLARYESRGDLAHVESVHFPGWVADHDREALSYWSAADEFERENGRLYSEYEASLPRELSRAQQIELARLLAEYVSTAPEGHMPCTWAIHDKGDGNPHVHILRSDRALDGYDRTPKRWFARAATGNKSRDEGGAAKVRSVIAKSHLEDVRAWWSQTQNKALERSGSTARVDHRTLAARGIERESTVHLGRTASAYLRTDREHLLSVETQRRIAHNRSVEAQAKVESLQEALGEAYEQWLGELRVEAEMHAKRPSPEPRPKPVVFREPTPTREAQEASSYDRYRPSYRPRYAPPATRARGSSGDLRALDSVHALPGGDVAYVSAKRPDGVAQLLSRDAPFDLVAEAPPRAVGLRRTAPTSAAGRLSGGGIGNLEQLVAQLLEDASAPSIIGIAFVQPMIVSFRLSPLADVHYEAVQGRVGMLYIRKRPDDRFALLDRGDRITVAHVDADTVRAGLALAASKWKSLELRGSVEFQRIAVRQAILLGLDSCLAKVLSPLLEEVRRSAKLELASQRTAKAAGMATALPTAPPSVSARNSGAHVSPQSAPKEAGAVPRRRPPSGRKL